MNSFYRCFFFKFIFVSSCQVTCRFIVNRNILRFTRCIQTVQDLNTCRHRDTQHIQVWLALLHDVRDGQQHASHPWVQFWWQDWHWPSLLGNFQITVSLSSSMAWGQRATQWGPSWTCAHWEHWSWPCRRGRLRDEHCKKRLAVMYSTIVFLKLVHFLIHGSNVVQMFLSF